MVVIFLVLTGQKSVLVSCDTLSSISANYRKH